MRRSALVGLVTSVVAIFTLPANSALAQQGPNAGTRPVRSEHFRTQHLTTDRIAALASAASVNRVIVTHIAGGGAADTAGYFAQINQGFAGLVTIASDGDRFSF